MTVKHRQRRQPRQTASPRVLRQQSGRYHVADRNCRHTDGLLLYRSPAQGCCAQISSHRWIQKPWNALQTLRKAIAGTWLLTTVGSTPSRVKQETTKRCHEMAPRSSSIAIKAHAHTYYLFKTLRRYSSKHTKHMSGL